MKEKLPIRRCAVSGAGFTVLELLVATAITAVLAALLIGITANVLDSWNKSRGDLTISNQAKMALDELTLDLESAIMRDDGRVWLAATVQPDQNSAAGDSNATTLARWTATSGGRRKPGAVESLNLEGAESLPDPEGRRLEQFRFGMAGVWLRFFTTERDNNSTSPNLSAPRAVAYQILRYRSGANLSSPIQYALFRTWVQPDSTFGAGFSLFHNGASVAAYNIPNGTAGAPGAVRQPSKDSIIANHVIDFGIRVWGRDASGVAVVLFPRGNDNRGFACRAVPSDFTEPNTLPPTPTTGAPTAAQMSYGFPTEVEVFLRILTDEGAAVMEAYERGQVTSGSWWELAEANSQVYLRRIKIRAVAP